VPQDAHRPTIAAIATASAPAAIGVLRISGPKAIEIADAMTKGKASKATERRATLCNVTEHNGQIIDETLLTVFRSPRSYTGEDVCEFAAHGGTLIMHGLLSRALACGATLAGPGEFTQQAFLHGKLDLTQAEAVMDLIAAQSHFALRAAHEQLQGALGQSTQKVRDDLMEALAHIEAYIDFPEEDISPDVGAALEAGIFQARQTIEQLLATADRGRILRDGLRTVIFGAPNTGKSSLLNRLLGFERAIVSQTAGTTRDSIEETINCGGVLLRLIDTAGIREHSEDPIETEGMRRSHLLREQADLVLHLFDASEPKPAVIPEPIHEHQHLIFLLNKADIGEHPSWQDISAIRLSCLLGTGLDELEATLLKTVFHSTLDDGQSLVSINARHQDCLRRAMLPLQSALMLIHSQHDLVLISIELRDSIAALGEIAGKVDADDLLGIIFSRFCIGK
jgi:tRNA modification GTPase